MISAFVIAAFFAWTAWLIRPRPLPDETVTTGTVCEVWSWHPLVDPTVRSRVEFRDTDGRTWRFESGFGGPIGEKPTVGKEVPVRYSPSDPQGTARRTGGAVERLHWALAAVAAGCLLTGLARLLG